MTPCKRRNINKVKQIQEDCLLPKFDLDLEFIFRPNGIVMYFYLYSNDIALQNSLSGNVK